MLLGRTGPGGLLPGGLGEQPPPLPCRRVPPAARPPALPEGDARARGERAPEQRGARRCVEKLCAYRLNGWVGGCEGEGEKEGKKKKKKKKKSNKTKNRPKLLT